MMYVSETCWWQTQPVLLLSLCWPSTGRSNFSSLRIQFSTEKWNLIKHALSYQFMLKYNILDTVKCSNTVLYCFQSRQDYCGGSCLFHYYPLCEVMVHGNYVYLALILDKGILEKGLVEHLPSLFHIRSSLKRKKKKKFCKKLNICHMK